MVKRSDNSSEWWQWLSRFGVYY